MLYFNFVTKTFWDRVVKKHVMHTWEVAAHLGRLKHAADVCSSHFRMPSEACQTTPRLNVRYQAPTMASVTYLWKDFVKAASRSHWGFFGTALSCNTFPTHLHLDMCSLAVFFDRYGYHQWHIISFNHHGRDKEPAAKTLSTTGSSH